MLRQAATSAVGTFGHFRPDRGWADNVFKDLSSTQTGNNMSLDALANATVG
jgi:hypothetical protein